MYSSLVVFTLWSIVQELSKLCDIIVEPLRDRIVTSLLQASLVNFFTLDLWKHIFYSLFELSVFATLFNLYYHLFSCF